MDEERTLTDAYRLPKNPNLRKPEGQGLNDLYVRFFRMAERRIAEKTGLGVVCFISNYSWLDGLSFTGMRERYLEAFDAVRVDCLNGDKYKTGKVSPDGSPDPSIFSTEGDPVGIQVGTAIATLVRKADHEPADRVDFRHLWGQAKRADLIETADAAPDALYDGIVPVLPLGLPFVRTAVSTDWFDWPSLPDLFPESFPGVQSKRDSFLIDIDLHCLRARLADYFDKGLSHEVIAQRYPVAMKGSSGFTVRDARLVRDALLARGGPTDTGFVRHAYRPFDERWLYWEPGHGLLGRPVPDYWPNVFEGNSWLVAQHKPRREWSPPQVISQIGGLDLIDRGATCIPVWLRDDGIGNGDTGERRANLSGSAQRYLDRMGLGVEDLFHHALATLHDPTYRAAQCRGAAHGVAAHPAAGLAGRRSPGRGGRPRPLGGARAHARRAARSRHPRSRRDAGAASTGDRCHRRPRHDERTQHDGRRFRGHRRLGPPRPGRRSDARPGLRRRARIHAPKNVRRWVTHCLPWAIRPPKSTSTVTPSGATSPPPSGPTSSAATRSSRNGCPNRERNILGRALQAEEVQHFTDTSRRIAAIAIEHVRNMAHDV